MSRQKRYTHVSQINADIDRCHADSRRKLAEAEQQDTEANAFFSAASDLYEKASNAQSHDARKALQEAAANQKNNGNMRREEARKLRLAATNLVEKKARKLGCKAAEFQTLTLPGIVPDASVEKKL